MDDSIEIRHTPQEKIRQMLVTVLFLLTNDLMRLKFGDTKIEHLPYYLLLDLSLVLLAWWFLSREFVRADSIGITSRRWFIKSEMKWEQIASYSADWQMGFDDFLFSSYGWHNLQGKIVLKHKNGHNSVKLKVDLGSRAQRSSFRTFIMIRLQTLVA